MRPAGPSLPLKPSLPSPSVPSASTGQSWLPANRAATVPVVPESCSGTAPIVPLTSSVVALAAGAKLACSSVPSKGLPSPL